MWGDGRLIDADDAIRRSREPSIYDLTDVPDFLAECPTVDAEPVRHGRWIEAHHGSYVRCTVCKTAFIDDHEAWPYCPVCGARMDGGAQ